MKGPIKAVGQLILYIVDIVNKIVNLRRLKMRFSSNPPSIRVKIIEIEKERIKNFVFESLNCNLLKSKFFL